MSWWIDSDSSSHFLVNVFSSYKIHLIVTFGLIIIIKTCKSYFGGAICKCKSRVDGKTVLITGANTGIGKETALDLAKRGARVILACRDLDKANQAADEIRLLSGNGNVIVKKLDLSSLKLVKEFANVIKSEEERIDLLINNAGLICNKATTVDGLDMLFVSNYLGHFLLTTLLLDKLTKAGSARIINVSSIEHENGQMNWDDIMFEKNYSTVKAYRQSKLANVLFTRELSKRLANTHVTVNTLHPGVVNSSILRHQADTYWFIFFIIRIPLMFVQWLLMKTPEQGAQTTIYCAVSEDLENVSGQYFSDCKVKPLLPNALNDNDALKLWQISEEYCKKYL